MSSTDLTHAQWCRLRAGVRERLVEWSGEEWAPNRGIAEMLLIFDYKSYEDLQANHTPEFHQKLEALLGDHGYTLWKAWRAQRNADTDGNLQPLDGGRANCAVRSG